MTDKEFVVSDELTTQPAPEWHVHDWRFVAGSRWSGHVECACGAAVSS